MKTDLSEQRPTWAEINLNNLAHNVKRIKNRVGAKASVMAVVKANAYGHGSVACAKRISSEGVDWFGVALPEEGVELRAAGITQPILCLAGFWQDQAALCVQHRLTPVVYRPDMLRAFNQVAKAAGVLADVHVKIDTGMGRLGVRFDELSEFLSVLIQLENIRVDGLLTHFAAADDAACQPLTQQQIRRFNDATTTFRQHGYSPSQLHLANSAGVYNQSEGWGNMVRAGGVLYGLWRDVLSLAAGDPQLLPVMSVYSRISFLKWVPRGETIGYGCTFEASRRSLIATVPIGYHDGYLRGLSNRANVIIRHCYAPVVGRVSMDLTLVDVTGIEGVQLDDKVTLLGVDELDSELSVTAEDLARIAGTISYEVTCGVSGRVPRVYVG